MPQAAIDQLMAALATNADNVDYAQLFADAADISTSTLKSGYRGLFSKLTIFDDKPGMERVHKIAETLGYYLRDDDSLQSSTSPFDTWQSVVSQVLYDRLSELENLETLGQEERDRALQDARGFLEVNSTSQEGERAKALIDYLVESDLEDVRLSYRRYLDRPDRSNLEEGAALIQQLKNKRVEFQRRYPTASQNDVIQGGIEKLVAEQLDIALNSVTSQTELLPKEIHSVWIGGALTGNKANILGQWAVANPDYNVNLWYDSDALLVNLVREAINEQIDRVLPPLSPDDDPQVYQNQRAQAAKPVYDYLAQWLRENPGDAGRSFYLTAKVYRDFLLKKFRLGPSTSEEQLIEAIEDYRTKLLWELQGTASRIGVRLRDIRTELWPNFQNAAFYEKILRLYGGHLGSASDLARVGILAQEGGLYTDVDIAPVQPLGDYYLSPHLAQFLPAQKLVDGQVVDIAFALREQRTPITVHLGVAISHKNGTLINLLAGQQAESYKNLPKIKTIHNYIPRVFSGRFSVLQPIYKAVDELFFELSKLRLVGVINFISELRIPPEYYNQFTEEEAISEWEIGPARLLRQKLDQQLDYLNEWQKPLQELREKDTSGLTELELAAHKTRLEELQKTLASHYKEAAWKAFRQVTSLDTTTGRIVSENEERAILAELDERFQDVAPKYLPYETRRAVLATYNRGILPIPYGVEAIPPSPGENLLERLEQEVAIHLAALDLYETGGGQGSALATLRQSLERELVSGAPVDHERLLSLVRQIETHSSSNQGWVSLITELKQPNLLDGLISYLPDSGELVYEGIAVYDEVLVVVDLAGLSQGSALEDRLASALAATLDAEKNGVPFAEFLQQQQAITESPGYRFSYSEAGLYSLLRSNLPVGVSLGSSPDLAQGLQALTNRGLNITSILEPIFAAISQGLVEPNIWVLPVNQALTTLEPEARLELASALGFDYLQRARSVLSERETLLTEEFLDGVAVYKLFLPDILQNELKRNNQEEIKKVLQRVSTEVLQAYAQQFGQNAYGVSYEQETQDTLVRVFELATDEQKVILARSLSEQYQITQHEFLPPVLERIGAEAILQEQAQILEYEQYINNYWKILNTFI